MPSVIQLFILINLLATSCDVFLFGPKLFQTVGCVVLMFFSLLQLLADHRNSCLKMNGFFSCQSLNVLFYFGISVAQFLSEHPSINNLF